ncbi:hypothetical protein JTB14_032941 [Gonioctena quinquepunctata]|nr:hypothetical protein JTB14_032941 [Gonioctena quinquepunctata]
MLNANDCTTCGTSPPPGHAPRRTFGDDKQKKPSGASASTGMLHHSPMNHLWGSRNRRVHAFESSVFDHKRCLQSPLNTISEEDYGMVRKDTLKIVNVDLDIITYAYLTNVNCFKE